MNRPEPNEKPLQSWKEIAVYLERDVRTAHRWEKEAGLPVRRHTDKRHASVYAYPSEIEAWRAARPLQAEESSIALWKRPRLWVAVGALAAAAAAIIYGPFLNPKAPTAEAADGAMRAELVPNGVADPASSLSRDGRWLLYPDWSTGDLAIRELATSKDRHLTHKGTWDGDKSMAEWNAMSPDGRYAAYSWFDAPNNRMQVRVVAVDQPDGPAEPTVLFNSPSEEDYVEVEAWLDDSRVLFLRTAEDRATRLMVGDRRNGENSALKSFGWVHPDEISASPDGRWIAYGLQGDVFVMASDGAQETRVTEHPAADTPAFWTPDGSHLAFRSDRAGRNDLWAIQVVDGRQVASPKLVHSGLNVAQTTGITQGGEFYYLTNSGTVDIFETSVDIAAGRVIEPPKAIDLSVVGKNRSPKHSPDGRSMAYFSERPQSGTVVVLRDLATGTERDLTASKARLHDVSWAPNSANLLYSGRDSQGRRAIYSINTDGGDPKLLFYPHSNASFNVGWMPDGGSVHYGDTLTGGGEGVFIQDLATGQHRLAMPIKGYTVVSPSPDGKQFAVYNRPPEDGAPGDGLIVIGVFDIATGKMQHLAEFQRPERADQSTAWTPDGKMILFWKRNKDDRQGTRELWAIPVDGGVPKSLGLRVTQASSTGMLDIHPDGKRIVFHGGSAKREMWKLSNFLDRIASSD